MNSLDDFILIYDPSVLTSWVDLGNYIWSFHIKCFVTQEMQAFVAQLLILYIMYDHHQPQFIFSKSFLQSSIPLVETNVFTQNFTQHSVFAIMKMLIVQMAFYFITKCPCCLLFTNEAVSLTYINWYHQHTERPSRISI